MKNNWVALLEKTTHIRAAAIADMVNGEPRVSFQMMWDPTSTFRLQSTCIPKEEV